MPPEGKPPRPQTVGMRDEGRDNIFRGNRVDGFDIGVDARGIGLTAENNRINAPGQPVDIKFPPPDGRYSALSNGALVQKIRELAEEIAAWEEREKLKRSERWRTGAVADNYDAFASARQLIFEKKFQPQGLSLASEGISRLKAFTLNQEALYGAETLSDGMLAGNAPLTEIATFLTVLADDLAKAEKR